MMLLPCTVRFALGAAIVLAAVSGGNAQGRLDARYSISFAGITVGEATWQASVTGRDYTAAASGRASGLVKVVASGEGVASAQGSVREGRLIPERYVSVVTRDETLEVDMAFADGTITRLNAAAPSPAPERVPVQDSHKAGIVDPISALLVETDSLGAKVCQRTLPLFDGRHRYDLQLGFKRRETVQAQTGYKGPAVVCRVTFKPVAGHRTNSTLIKFLADGRDIELWMAPVAGTGLVAPFRASIASLLGSLVIEASHFETAALPTLRADAQ